ncbi:MAG: hypothetical protein IK019_04035 [Clostridia bacterium]|nr:hypothetical protein [Clostridia bacterium]
MRKEFASIAEHTVPICMTVLPAVAFYWAIMNYQPHHDSYLSSFVEIGCIICGILLFCKAIKRKQTGIAVLYCLAILSGGFFLYWTMRIPLCLACEPMRKQDLGYMLKPFADRFGEYLPD